MKMRRMKRVRAVVAFATLATAAFVLPTRRAQAADVLVAAGLPTPDQLYAMADQMGLTVDQISAIEKTVSKAREEAATLERAVNEQQAAFTAALRNTKVTAADADAALAKLLHAEAEVKRLQVRTLLQVRQLLTAEQLARVMAMAEKAGPAGAPAAEEGVPPAMSVKAKRLRAAVESLGVPATRALQERATRIEQMVKEGKLDAAHAALDQLIVDTKLDDFEAKPAQAVDFTKVAPGDTDVPTLQRRLEQVTERAQGIINLPLLRDLIKAREAVEDAKSRQDAKAVGRILTWAEKAVAP